MNHSFRSRLLFLALIVSQTGCGIFIGNVRPVEEKSDEYRVLDLSRWSDNWSRLEPAEDGKSTEVSDQAYQSQATASIISLNSACRPSIQEETHSLQEFARQLHLGFSNPQILEQKEFKHKGSPALRTTLKGSVNGEQMMLRTVVIRHEDCLYDLMYVSRPRFFDREEPVFSRFLESLRLR